MWEIEKDLIICGKLRVLPLSILVFPTAIHSTIPHVFHTLNALTRLLRIYNPFF